jgi:hypothetical protein
MYEAIEQMSATKVNVSKINATNIWSVFRILELKLGSSGPAVHAHRHILGRPRESNLTSVLHSATQRASVTSWEASDVTHPSIQSLHASIPHH